MSNLQDVPLAEPETMPTTEQEAGGSKSNSLKRFFKISKKPSTFHGFNEDASEPDDDAKDGGKRNSIGRFFTKLKGSTKTGNIQFVESDEPGQAAQSNTVDLGVEQTEVDKPMSSVKPKLKASISSYWKQLFHRQKVVYGQDQDPIDMQQTLEEEQSEVAVPQEVATTAPPAAAAAAIAATETVSAIGKDIESAEPENIRDNASYCVPEIIEEVQMLAVSDEGANSSNAENTD